jgi:hypothetical protein
MWIELVTTKNEKKIMSEITEALGGDARVVKAKFLMKQIKHNRITTLPLEKDAASENSKKSAKFLELDTSKGFRECVSYHVIRRTVDYVDMSMSNGLPNEMKMNIDMLGSTMKGGIF